MTWSSPLTFTAGAVLTAAQLNTYVSDNLAETCPATATTAGDLVYADAANSMGNRLGIGSAGSLLVSSGSAPVWRAPATDLLYQDGSSSQAFTLTTFSVSPPGLGVAALPVVTVTTGTHALVVVSARFVLNTTAGANTEITYSISGATTVAANVGPRSAVHESGAAGDLAALEVTYLETGLTAGSNTFQMEAKVSAGSGTVSNPKMIVIPL